MWLGVPFVYKNSIVKSYYIYHGAGLVYMPYIPPAGVQRFMWIFPLVHASGYIHINLFSRWYFWHIHLFLTMFTYLKYFLQVFSHFTCIFFASLMSTQMTIKITMKLTSTIHEFTTILIK